MVNQLIKNNVVQFDGNDFILDVTISPDTETVWLSVDQLCTLFDKNKSTISRHIHNIFSENEVDQFSSVANFATELNKYDPRTGKNRKTNVYINYYNLDVIISVGYRVKSRNGIIFRKWANKILKEYMIKGYAINEKRLEVLNKTIEIQTKMLAHSMSIDVNDIDFVIKSYTNALSLLDDYDHQCVIKPVELSDNVYELTYDECKEVIAKMAHYGTTDVFGVEKEKGKFEGILAAVYQQGFGIEMYPSIEEKAANLLYFLVKDHPFADGCKRIAATLFVHFLNQNNFLFKDGKQIISNSTLVAVTIMIAESNPREKEIIIHLLMNILQEKN